MFTSTDNPLYLLKKFRSDRNMSLQAAAIYVGVTASFLSKVERGKKKPSLEKLLKMGTVYGIPLETVAFIAGALGIKSLNDVQYSDRSYDMRIGDTYFEFKKGREEVKKEKMDNSKTEEKITPNFNVDPNRTLVLYADNVSLKANNNGIVLDFAQQIGPTNQYNIVSRIGMSKDHAKQLIEHLEAVLRSDGTRSTAKKDS